MEIGPWTVEVDVEATRSELYAEAVSGCAECGCRDCRNFIAARDRIYAAPVRQLLASMGIAGDKELEAYPLGPDIVSGGIHYGGWFPFIGLVTGGPQRRVERLRDDSTQVWPEPREIAP